LKNPLWIYCEFYSPPEITIQPTHPKKAANLNSDCNKLIHRPWSNYLRQASASPSVVRIRFLDGGGGLFVGSARKWPRFLL